MRPGVLYRLLPLLLLTGCVPDDQIPDVPPPGVEELVAVFGATEADTFVIRERDTRGDGCRLDTLSVYAEGERSLDVFARERDSDRRLNLGLGRDDLVTATAGDTLDIDVRGTGCGRGNLSEGWGRFYVTFAHAEAVAGVFAADLYPLCGPTGCGIGPRKFRVVGGARFDTTATVDVRPVGS